jgi:hypothetical protein
MKWGHQRAPLLPIFLCVCVLFASCGTDTSTGTSGGSGTSAGGGTTSTSDLATIINEYRQEQGLEAIALSASLTEVAQAHVDDMEANPPDRVTCTIHSWSVNSNWSDCCYTIANPDGNCMNSKPAEITTVYTGSGYEVAVYYALTLTPEISLDSWKGSDAHNDVLLNKNTWLHYNWKAMGAAISTHYAVAWFGTMEDPAGTP